MTAPVLLLPEPIIPIDVAMADPNLFGAALGDLSTWTAWRTILKAAWAISLTDEEAELFEIVCGGRKAPPGRVRELVAIVGRRSGKSRMAALGAVYCACFVDHASRLAPGETGFVLVLAASKSQAQRVFAYCLAFLENSPILKQKIIDVTAEEIRLVGNIVIAVHSANYRTIRGRTLVACIFDEAAFWRSETSSQPDTEAYRAVLPALATTKGILIVISSPYAQRGLVWQKHKDCFGKNNPEILVVQAPTATFNPVIDRATIEQALADDPEAADAEWNANFRGDLAAYIDRATIEACVDRGVLERPFERVHRYSAFIDPSGGQHDSMTLGVAHREGARAVLDLVREWKAPFDPQEVVLDVAMALKPYRVTSVRGDKYGAAWVSGALRKVGLRFFPSELTRSEIYINALPLLTSGEAALLDNQRLIGQIAQLERRTTRGGRDLIDHMKGAMDDVCNSGLGALVHAAKGDVRAARGQIVHQGANRFNPHTGAFRA